MLYDNVLQCYLATVWHQGLKSYKCSLSHLPLLLLATTPAVNLSNCLLSISNWVLFNPFPVTLSSSELFQYCNLHWQFKIILSSPKRWVTHHGWTKKSEGKVWGHNIFLHSPDQGKCHRLHKALHESRDIHPFQEAWGELAASFIEINILSKCYHNLSRDIRSHNDSIQSFKCYPKTLNSNILPGFDRIFSQKITNIIPLSCDVAENNDQIFFSIYFLWKNVLKKKFQVAPAQLFSFMNPLALEVFLVGGRNFIW